MITWITTVGWSPFAVINPIWAYCKENDECPNKIILIYTPYDKIKNNVLVCKRYIIEILKSYNGKNLSKESIIQEEIESDNIEIYADKLNKVIEREKKFKPEKIVLDMTPGRKYMSAINVYYGYSLSETPIQVYYLHLEESKYQDVPYPLSPIIKNELIDILESTKIFSNELGKTSYKEGKEDDEDLGGQLLNSIKEDDEKKDYLTLLAIKKNFTTKTKIRKFTFSYDLIIRGHEIDKILKGLIIDDYVVVHPKLNNNQKYKSYDITEKGKDFLIDLKHKTIIKEKEGK